MILLLRRLWWATLPYEGWASDYGPDSGAVPCPWWAYPLAWVHRAVNLAIGDRDVFGPRCNAYFERPLVSELHPKVWQ